MNGNSKHKLSSSYLTSAAGEVFLTEGDLAQRWSISIKTLQAARFNKAGISYCKIGRSVRYRFADVLAYEERQVRHSTCDTGRRAAASPKEARS